MRGHKFLILLVAIAGLIVIIPCAPMTISDIQQSPQEIAKKTFPSVVVVLINDKNGQPVSLGSGFVIRNGIVATNLHVIEDGVSGVVKMIGADRQYPIEGILATSDKYDLALLSIPDLRAPTLMLSDRNVLVGDTIYAIGNPRGLEGTFSEGIVSSIRKLDEDELIQITAPISPGSSGGPVVNIDCDIIGVATATIMEGQNLNFAVPARYLEQLLETERKLAPLSSAKKQKGSYTNAFGDKSINGLRCEHFLWSDASIHSLGPAAFTFTIRNELNETVRNIVIYIIFYDSNSKPLDVFKYESRQEIDFGATVIPGLRIPPNLAKRVDGYVDSSVKELTTKQIKENYVEKWSDKPFTKVEYRILSFELVR